MSIVPLALLKAQLNIIGTEDDALLQHKLDAAEGFAGNYIGKCLGVVHATDGTLLPLPPAIVEAVLQLAAHWYENREAALVGLSADVLPFGVAALLSPFAEWVM